jgi:hypothetical protein
MAAQRPATAAPARQQRGGAEQPARAQAPAQGELHDIGVAAGKGGFAVGEVELPDAHEARVEAQAAHLRSSAQEVWRQRRSVSA